MFLTLTKPGTGLRLSCRSKLEIVFRTTNALFYGLLQAFMLEEARLVDTLAAMPSSTAATANNAHSS